MVAPVRFSRRHSAAPPCRRDRLDVLVRQVAAAEVWNGHGAAGAVHFEPGRMGPTLQRRDLDDAPRRSYPNTATPLSM